MLNMVTLKYLNTGNVFKKKATTVLNYMIKN
jgi:hypothetical protein